MANCMGGGVRRGNWGGFCELELESGGEGRGVRSRGKYFGDGVWM